MFLALSNNLYFSGGRSLSPNKGKRKRSTSPSTSALSRKQKTSTPLPKPLAESSQIIPSPHSVQPSFKASGLTVVFHKSFESLKAVAQIMTGLSHERMLLLGAFK